MVSKFTDEALDAALQSSSVVYQTWKYNRVWGSLVHMPADDYQDPDDVTHFARVASPGLVKTMAEGIPHLTINHCSALMQLLKPVLRNPRQLTTQDILRGIREGARASWRKNQTTLQWECPRFESEVESLHQYFGDRFSGCGELLDATLQDAEGELPTRYTRETIDTLAKLHWALSVETLHHLVSRTMIELPGLVDQVTKTTSANPEGSEPGLEDTLKAAFRKHINLGLMYVNLVRPGSFATKSDTTVRRLNTFEETQNNLKSRIRLMTENLTDMDYRGITAQLTLLAAVGHPLGTIGLTMGRTEYMADEFGLFVCNIGPDIRLKPTKPQLMTAVTSILKAVKSIADMQEKRSSALHLPDDNSVLSLAQEAILSRFLLSVVQKNSSQFDDVTGLGIWPAWKKRLESYRTGSELCHDNLLRRQNLKETTTYQSEQRESGLVDEIATTGSAYTGTVVKESTVTPSRKQKKPKGKKNSKTTQQTGGVRPIDGKRQQQKTVTTQPGSLRPVQSNIDERESSTTDVQHGGESQLESREDLSALSAMNGQGESEQWATLRQGPLSLDLHNDTLREVEPLDINMKEVSGINGEQMAPRKTYSEESRMTPPRDELHLYARTEEGPDSKSCRVQAEEGSSKWTQGGVEEGASDTETITAATEALDNPESCLTEVREERAEDLPPSTLKPPSLSSTELSSDRIVLEYQNDQDQNDELIPNSDWHPSAVETAPVPSSYSRRRSNSVPSARGLQTLADTFNSQDFLRYL